MIPVSVHMRREDESIWYGQHDRLLDLPTNVLTPEVSNTCATSASSLGDDEPTWAYSQYSIANALDEILPNAPSCIIRLVEDVCLRRVSGSTRALKSVSQGQHMRASGFGD